MPPSRPLSGRVRTSNAPSARKATKAMPRRSAPSRFGVLRGKVSGIAAFARRARRVPRAQSAGGTSWASKVWRRDPSWLARNRRAGARASAFAPAPGFSAWRPATRLPKRTAASPRARYCRQPVSPCGRTQSPRWLPRCSCRCRAKRAIRPRCRENSRHGVRPPPAHRRADCARARNSRVRPRAFSTSSSCAAAKSRIVGQRARNRA